MSARWFTGLMTGFVGIVSTFALVWASSLVGAPLSPYEAMAIIAFLRVCDLQVKYQHD